MKTKLFSAFLFLFIAFSGFSQGDDETETPTFATVRLGLNTQSNFYRQILLGFMDANASDGVDPGYDAINVNNFANDMYFLCGTTPLFIQGVGYFNTDNSYAIGVTSTMDGVIKFNLEEITNLDTNQNVYIYDALTNTYNDLKEKTFEIFVEAGTVNDRFSLRFNNTTLGTATLNQGNFSVAYSNNNSNLIINNPNNLTVKNIAIYAISGQKVASEKVNANNTISVSLSNYNLSKGIYIVDVDSKFRKKIVVE